MTGFPSRTVDNSISSTIVLHAGGIGDFLLACPALAALAQEGPIELLGRRERLELAVTSGIAQACHDMDSCGFASVFSEPSDNLRSFLARYERAVVWMRDDGTIRRGLEECGLRNARLFPGLPPSDWTDHASAYYGNCLGFAELPPLRLFLGGDADANQNDVIIQPGSGGRQKNWPLENFLSLADALKRQGRNVAWSLGPAEEHISLPAVVAAIPEGSLVQLGRALSKAALFIGNDSGTTHLAAAVGCRTVAIFGQTDPKVWAPRGGNVSVVQREPWPAVNDVLAAILVV
jgi:glycosyl transferase family 9 (putative heptosyltransferase)